MTTKTKQVTQKAAKAANPPAAKKPAAKKPAKADALVERIEKVETWLGSQGINVRQFGELPAPAVEEGAKPEPPRKLTLEERVARLELAAQTHGGITLP